MINLSVIIKHILALVPLALSIWLVGNQSVYEEETTVPITTNDLVVESTSGTTKYSYGTMDFEGGKCFCQRLAFRSAQAFLVATGATAVNSDTLTIITRWSTHGAEELFHHEFGWPEHRVVYPPDLTNEAYLTQNDAIYYFVPAEGDIAWKVQAKTNVFPKGFFEKRTAVQTATTPEAKTAAQQAFMPLKNQAIANLTTLPLTNSFTVKQVKRSELTFAGWRGQWTSVHTFLDNTAMDVAYKAIAALSPQHSEQSVKDFVKTMYHADFTALDIHTNVISYTLSPTQTIRCAYEEQGIAPAGGSHGGWWFTYHTSDTNCAKFANLIVTHVHGSERMPHWHLRYGDTTTSFNDLISNPTYARWGATAVASGTTVAQYAQDAIEEAANYVAMLPPPLNQWIGTSSGKWASGNSYLDDTTMQQVYQKIAQATGKAYSADHVKQALKMMYHTVFSRMNMANDTITFVTDSPQQASSVVCDYQSLGKETAAWGTSQFTWHKFQSTSSDPACKAYTYVIATDIHGHDGGITHWHMRYGATSFNDLMTNPKYIMWWPTMAPETTTAQQFAGDMENEAEEMATMVQVIMPEPLGTNNTVYLPLITR